MSEDLPDPSWAALSEAIEMGVEPRPKPHDLAAWWRVTAEDEIDAVVAKATEYGGSDLIEMGRSLAAMAGRPTLNDEQLAELGCLQYLVGKVTRATSAWADGRMPSDDTYHDIGVYVRMIQRIRDVGGWPK